MSYSRRLVCDIDDTISQTFNRDWENAKPIQEVIDKINHLYSQGWEVFLVTARGQLSCNGDSEAADRKYRKIIESWLKRHNVLYHKLSFKKELASYYIDDKALSPKEFLDLKLKTISSGWSGAIVEQRGDRIFKTHKDSLLVAEWYSVASKFFKTPEVYSVIGETISMEFIENNAHLNLGEVISIMDIMEGIVPYKGGKFSTYIERMIGHCELGGFQFILPKLREIQDYCDTQLSFCHGDFSHENIIPNQSGHYLIDPIFNPDKFSSYLLDVTKFLYSLRRDGMMFEYDYVKNNYLYSGVPLEVLDILEATQWIRVYKYAPETIKEFIHKNIMEYATKFREGKEGR